MLRPLRLALILVCRALFTWEPKTFDVRSRMSLNMRLMGAEVRPVESGSRTLRDAVNEAMRDWMSSVENTHYIIGSVIGRIRFR